MKTIKRCFVSNMNTIKFWQYVSIEPAYVFYILAFWLKLFATTNLYLQKACRNVTKSEPDLNTPCDEEAGINFLNYVNSNFRFENAFITVLFLIIFCTWSDKAGKKRKIFIIIPIINTLFENILYFFQSYFWHWPVMTTVFTEFFIECFGSFYSFVIFSTMYICDVSKNENRTMRITILLALKTGCVLVSKAVSGFLIHRLGFSYTYLISLILSLLALICGIVFIKDISVPIKENITICSAFSIKEIIESFKFVFKKSTGNRRLILYFLIIINVLSWCAFTG